MESSLHQLQPIEYWGIKNTKPFVISGPCSAETEEQVHETVAALAKTEKVNLIRAGIWKPRTRPNSFEGVGKVGLRWLKEAGRANRLPVTTEVANAHHVEAALKAEIDVLWIGARTTVNPFSVQEIADALKGVSIPVMVKNPINPDLNLWIGALERIQNAGIHQIAAIHRGFSNYGNTGYRNPPMWEIPINLKAIFPNLSLICDPSHICGRRDTLAHVAQKAMDLNYSGLLIESHRSPDDAWSDAQQQITPELLEKLLSNLVIRQTKSKNQELLNELDKLRIKIDDIDDQIYDLVDARMELSDKIGQYKKEHHLTILQIKRWKEIQERMARKGADLGLSEDTTQRLIQIIHKESIRRQTKIMNESQ